MKTDLGTTLISKLNRIREELRVFDSPESKDAFLRNLEDVIAALGRLRAGLADHALQGKIADIGKPIEEVIAFLEFAKSDETLRVVVSHARKIPIPKPKRQPVDIPADLTNEQIRALLEKDLSKAELKAIAAQRSISVGKSSIEEIKRNILKNLERQEGYKRLATT